MTDEDIDYYIDFFYSLKDDHSLVQVDVVGSPIPKCFPAKEDGYGMDYIVEAADGIFLEICDTDWGPGLASMAAESVPDLRMFHLSEDPVVDTIEVTVDDEPIGETFWFYDETENAVVFHETPEAGALVVLDYTIQAECEQ